METETITLDQENNVKLIRYINEVDMDLPAMIVLPGGRYEFCAPNEGKPIADKFSKSGFQAFVLEYTVGNNFVWPKPLLDYENAIELILKNSKKWHINCKQIFVCGFSAGGHLAACATSINKHKPTAALLIYPAILNNILTKLKDGLPQAHELVNKNTCPCFLVSASDDKTVPINNTLKMCTALSKHNIQFESHVYSKGGHAFSDGSVELSKHPCCPRVQNWFPDALEWIKEVIQQQDKKH